MLHPLASPLHLVKRLSPAEGAESGRSPRRTQFLSHFGSYSACRWAGYRAASGNGSAAVLGALPNVFLPT